MVVLGTHFSLEFYNPFWS